MLKWRQEVYDATVLLDKKFETERDRADVIEASRLSGKEARIVAEVDKAMIHQVHGFIFGTRPSSF